jgi:hypothetical protein
MSQLGSENSGEKLVKEKKNTQPGLLISSAEIVLSLVEVARLEGRLR